MRGIYSYERVIQRLGSHPALTNFEPVDTAAKEEVVKVEREAFSNSRSTQGRRSTISSTSLLVSPFGLAAISMVCRTSVMSSRLGESA